MPTGIGGVDAVLGGGLLRGSAYIVQGPPGAGKTILANQICFNAAASGEPALYVSLLAEAHDRLLTYMRPLRFYDAALVPERVSYLSAYPILEKEGPGALQRMLLEEVRRRGARVVVLDGLFVIHDAFGSEPAFRRFVHEMQGLASLAGCSLLMLTNQARSRAAPEHTMVDGWIELLDEIHGLRAVRALVVHKQRGSAYLRGRHLYRITDAGITLFPRLEAAQPCEPDTAPRNGRIGSGIAQFDTMLMGGYPPASSTFLLGPSGSGKTTFGLHFLGRCTPEEPGLLFGFYETPTRLMVKARRIGLDLEGLVARGAVEVIWQPDADNLVDELGHRLITAAQRRRAKRIFVDGLGSFERAMLHKQRLPALVAAIHNILQPLGATILYSREVQELDMLERLPDSDLSTMAENLILFHYARQGRLLHRMLSILKLRDSDFDPFAEEFHITPDGVRFGRRPLATARPAEADELPDVPSLGDTPPTGP
ncbi:RAD55 family ATPase [Falsiroseomonas sp.]|uniref:RAD55 family ATPase n=1 Tax=Falsiroseomonas sp. TaxID=2870721 RepID=UPI003569F5FA